MLSFYSVPACKPWGCPENTKGTMGKAPEVQGPATNTLGRPLKPSASRVENVSTVAGVLRILIPRNRGAHHFYMFSFPDARKAHNRLRWIGETRKMAGTSGNSVSGSYRVQSTKCLVTLLQAPKTGTMFPVSSEEPLIRA